MNVKEQSYKFSDGITMIFNPVEPEEWLSGYTVEVLE